MESITTRCGRPWSISQGPSKHRHLNSPRKESQIDPQRLQQHIGKRSRRQNNRRCRYLASCCVDPCDLATPGEDSCRVGLQGKRHAEVLCGSGETVDGGNGIGISGCWFECRYGDVVCVQQGFDHSQLFNGHDSRVAAQPLVRFDIRPQLGFVLGVHDSQETDRLKPGIAGANQFSPVAETLSGFRASAVFPGHSNSARNQRSDFPLAPAADPRSMSRILLTPALASSNAVATPTTPPPMMTTSAVRGSAGDGSIERFDNDELIISMAIFPWTAESAPRRQIVASRFRAGRHCALLQSRPKEIDTGPLPNIRLHQQTAQRRAARSQSTILVRSRGLRVQLGNNNRLEDVNAK